MEPRSPLARPATWRAISTVLLVVFAVAFVVDGFSVPGWGWIALILSGVTFAVELGLVVLTRGSGERPQL